MNLDKLDPTFREKIEDEFLPALERVTGLKWNIVQAQRSIKYQNELWSQGRNGNPGSIVTNAKGGQSPHNFGLAVDVCPSDKTGGLWWNAPERYWKMMGELATGIGLVWGGNFKSIIDKPHIEAANWKEVQLAWINEGRPDIA